MGTTVERYRLSLFGRMILGVAHEVDNHLSVILGFSELIQIAAGNEQKVRESAGKVITACEKTGAVIGNYSRYVRPHPPARELFSPGAMIREILSFARYDLGRNNVTLAVPAPVHAGLLHCDRSDLALALLALLFNGSEAMAAGGGELGLSVGNVDGGWEFTVSDRGDGIPAGLEETIFEEGFTTRSEPYHAGMGGGFDEGFFLYYEDVDLCARLWKAGCRVLACPRAQVIGHDARRSSRRNLRYLRWHIASLARYVAKHWLRLPNTEGR